jgi:hypothetical protein
MSSVTPLASNLLRRQLAELTKHPVQGFSAGVYPIIPLHSFQRPRPDSHLREGLVDDNNLYEWEVMIIGSAFFYPLYSFPHLWTLTSDIVLRTLSSMYPFLELFYVF